MELVTLKIILEGMTRQIQAAISDHIADMQNDLKIAVQRAVDHFDFEREIQDAVNKELRRSMGDAIKTAVSQAAYDSAIQDQMTKAVLGTVKEALERQNELREKTLEYKIKNKEK